MNDYSSTGNLLNILIVSAYDIHSEWKAFTSWYSIQRILPDATVHLVLPRLHQLQFDSYRWATKANMKRFRYSDLSKHNIACSFLVKNSKPLLIVDTGTIAVREMPLNMNRGISEDKSVMFIDQPSDNYQEVNQLCCDCQSNESTVFTKIHSRCGHYNEDIWTKKFKSAPFDYIEKFKTPDTSMNERSIFKCWEEAKQMYYAMS